MKELSRLDLAQIERKRDKHPLVVCDEAAITCGRLPELVAAITQQGQGVVLMMLENQFQQGLRGWVKAQVLAALATNIEGVIPVSGPELKNELTYNWQNVLIPAPVIFDRKEMLAVSGNLETVEFEETDSDEDRRWIDRARQMTSFSNCWYDPAGCVFVRDGQLLIESVSTRYNQTECQRIPLAVEDLNLAFGERMMFCDSLHAERVGVAQASRRLISLEESTAYITKFPCRPCALSLISAGIRAIVFDEGSYGLIEAVDLFEANGVTLKRINR